MVAPYNDDLANAGRVTVGQSGVAAIGEATVETGETDLFGEWSTPDRSVWYRFVPDFTGFVSFEVIQCDDGNTPTPVWHLCQGSSIGTLTVLSPGYTFGGNTAAVEVAEGQEYLIRIAATDPANVLAQWTLRQYVWSEWTQLDDIEITHSQRPFGVVGFHDRPDEDTYTTSMSENPMPTIDDFLEHQMELLDLLHTGDDDSWFAPLDTGDGGSTDITIAAAGYFWTVDVGTDENIFDLHRVVSVSAEHDVQNTFITPAQGAVPAIPVHNGIEWSDTDFDIIRCELVYQLSLQGADPTDWYTGLCEYELVAYLPSPNPVHPYQPHGEQILDSGTLPDGSSLGQRVVTFDAADLAGMKYGVTKFDGIILYPRLHPTAPVSRTWAGNSESGVAYGVGAEPAWAEGDDPVTNWTLRWPQYRELIPVPGNPRGPARLLWPRRDDLGIGIGRQYPPPNTQQSGRGMGPGAPV